MLYIKGASNNKSPKKAELFIQYINNWHVYLKMLCVHSFLLESCYTGYKTLIL